MKLTTQGQLDDFLGRLFENYLFSRHRTIFLNKDFIWWELNRFRYTFEKECVDFKVVLGLVNILQDWGVPRNMLLNETNVLQEYLYFFLVKNVGLWII